MQAVLLQTSHSLLSSIILTMAESLIYSNPFSRTEMMLLSLGVNLSRIWSSYSRVIPSSTGNKEISTLFMTATGCKGSKSEVPIKSHYILLVHKLLVIYCLLAVPAASAVIVPLTVRFENCVVPTTFSLKSTFIAEPSSWVS